jgi:hypothetical protein
MAFADGVKLTISDKKRISSLKRYDRAISMAIGHQ